MTYLEMYLKDHPEEKDLPWWKQQWGGYCPSELGYEKLKSRCPNDSLPNGCRRCWDREAKENH